MFPPWDHDGAGECGMVLPQFFPCLSRQNGWSGLMFAAQNGHALVVEMLLTNGANKDLQENDTKTTALMIAAAQGHVLVVEKLLASGVDMDIQNTQGFTALIFSALLGHDVCLDLLLKAGARLDPKGPAMYFARENKHAKCVAVLEAAIEPLPEKELLRMPLRC
eukprot:FR735156.1.p1 GENE.FR735156.1~~FR735156.1.p1  ORF type:complete len:164 (+),score=29.65 FR735156.1:25-516(+)